MIFAAGILLSEDGEDENECMIYDIAQHNGMKNECEFVKKYCESEGLIDFT